MLRFLEKCNQNITNDCSRLDISVAILWITSCFWIGIYDYIIGYVYLECKVPQARQNRLPFITADFHNMVGIWNDVLIGWI